MRRRRRVVAERRRRVLLPGQGQRAVTNSKARTLANLNNTNYICVSSLARVNFGYVLLFPVWLVICKTRPEVGKKVEW